ncbi:EamA-like transporter family protein [Paraurantiacibacter namhicola]|uniref:EamA-like transporter family protein n=2 Tax=Paraurantiacibacter namhicola TaxID=645517 RepID=A0A1C7DBQ3_9SPHN|nr:EamA-like transporter family protein [Paraurantiacibacter namhicola]
MPYLAALAGVGMLALMDAFMKGASIAIGAYSASLLRYAIGFVIAAPIWLAAGGRWPRPEVLRVHLIRGVVVAFMALSFFYALTKLPIAETIAISFIAPLISLWLARVLLGEQVRREAVIAAIIGIAGTVVIIGGRIGREKMSEDAVLGLAAILFSAVLYAWNLVLQRQQAQVANPGEVAAFHSGVGGLTLAVAAPFLLVLPDAEVLAAIGVSSVLTVAGAMILAWAYARAEAQVLVPLEYTGFLWASLFGWLFFREAVTATTIAGAIMIAFGSWYAAPRRAPEQPT